MLYLMEYLLLLSYYHSMDELLVSAPMYSPEIDKPEYGIVYVYKNNQVSIHSYILCLFACIVCSK